jgi:hypothetical protein
MAMIYPRPVNGSKRWMHWTASAYACHANYRWHLDHMVKANIGGVKYLSDGNGNVGAGDSGLQFGIDVLARGMIPVVRYYMNAEHRWTDANSYATEANVRAGIVYIETLNEPDLALEHDSGSLPKDWLRRAFDNWIDHAHHITALGGIPLSPALASGAFGDRGQPTVAGQVRENPFVWVKQAGITRFVCSMHNYPLCHPIDYPNDSVNMYGTPLTAAERERTGGDYAWDSESLSVINARRMHDKNGPEASIEKDDSCFRACELFRRLLNEAGLSDVPVLTTEGGPVLTDRQDARYPRVTPVVMQEMIEQELAYLDADPLYLGYCWWLWANNAAGGTGGWSTCQWFWPGGPFSDSEGFIPAYRFLCDRPLSADGNPIPPTPDPTPEPIPEPGGSDVSYPDRTAPDWQLDPQWDPTAYTQATGKPGDVVWELVRIDYAPDANANTIWISVEGKDSKGVLPDGAQVHAVNGGLPEFVVPLKAPPDLQDIPMYKTSVVRLWITDALGRKSCEISNVRGDIVGLPAGVNAFHIGRSVYLARRTVPTVTPPPVDPPVTPPVADGWTTIYTVDDGTYRLQKKKE